MINLMNVDCMEYMKTVPDKFFDLAIVDPPYRDENQPTKDMRANGSMKTLEGRPDIKYWNELLRVSKNQIIWGANNFELPQWKGFIVWDKVIPFDFTMSMAEVAAISPDLGTVSKIFKYRISGSEDRVHPTQKPVALYKWLLHNYATCNKCNNTGNVYEDVVGDGGSQMLVDCEWCEVAETGTPKIFDSHLGSGSIAIACHDMKFDLVGTEIDKDYYDAAMKRFDNHKKQLTFF